jgi:hypothetical protein
LFVYNGKFTLENDTYFSDSLAWNLEADSVLMIAGDYNVVLDTASGYQATIVDAVIYD